MIPMDDFWDMDEFTAEKELKCALESARRANWDALHGPRHLRTGRFRPDPTQLPPGTDAAADASTPPSSEGT